MLCLDSYMNISPELVRTEMWTQDKAKCVLWGQNTHAFLWQVFLTWYSVAWKMHLNVEEIESLLRLEFRHLPLCITSSPRPTIPLFPLLYSQCLLVSLFQPTWCQNWPSLGILDQTLSERSEMWCLVVKNNYGERWHTPCWMVYPMWQLGLWDAVLIYSRQDCSDNYIKQVKLLLAGQQTSAQNHFTALYQQLSAFIYRAPVTSLWLESWCII